MNGWSQHVRRVSVALVGVAAMVSVALVAPASASAATTHGTAKVVSAPAKAPKHANIWEW